MVELWGAAQGVEEIAPQTAAASVRGCVLLLHRPVFRWNLLLHVHVHCEVVALLRARRCSLWWIHVTRKDVMQQELLSSIPPAGPLACEASTGFSQGC